MSFSAETLAYFEEQQRLALAWLPTPKPQPRIRWVREFHFDLGDELTQHTDVPCNRPFPHNDDILTVELKGSEDGNGVVVSVGLNASPNFLATVGR